MNNRNLFESVLFELHNQKILTDLILIGSWCLSIYKVYFNDAPEIPLLRTMDLDFLVSNPPHIHNKVDLPNILKKYGFDEDFSVLGGYSKFVHSELEIDFLIPEFGKGKDGPYFIKELNINAQGLRYLKLLQDHTILVDFKNIKVRVPEPSAFILLKYIISNKRKDAGKQSKDLLTANQLAEFLIHIPLQKEKLVNTFSSLPKKWRKQIIDITEKQFPHLTDVLRS